MDMGSSWSFPYRVIKIGGSAITCKDIPYCLKLDVARDVAKQLNEVFQKGAAPVLVHGGGSFGHYEASIKGPDMVPRTSHAMFLLNSLLNSLFMEEGIPTYSIPGRFFTLGLVRAILKEGLIPLVFGDILPDGEIISGDDIAISIAKDLQSGIVFLTDVEGVLDHNRVLECVESEGFQVKETGTIDVTGGMLAKVRKVLKENAYAVITSPRGENILRAMKGDRVGTRVGKCE